MTYECLKRAFEELPFMTAARHIRANSFHEHNLFVHLCRTAEYLIQSQNAPDVIAAGYLHDIAKVVLATPKPQGTYSKGANHAQIGECIILNMNAAFFASHGLNQRYTARLVGQHDAPLKLMVRLRQQNVNIESFVEGVKQYQQQLHQDAQGSDILDLFWADSRAKGNCEDLDELGALYHHLRHGQGSVADLFRIIRGKR
jgi:hypothetical protein